MKIILLAIITILSINFVNAEIDVQDYYEIIEAVESDDYYEADKFCVSDANCMINEKCVKEISGKGHCVKKPLVGECRKHSDCSPGKRCIGWKCR
jgi:hypothetical protein